MTGLIARAVAKFVDPPEIAARRCPVCQEPLVIDLFGLGFPGTPRRHWVWRHPYNGCGLEDNSWAYYGESNG